MSAVPEIMLNNGRTIPQFGFGVFLVEPEETVAAVSTALQTGYRHIDTAEGYGNEKEVGEAIRKSGLDRADVFVTSKLANDAHRPDDARRAFDASLDALGFDYLDLFLIHWPLPTRYDGDFVSTWRTLEEFYRDGRARSIGVSNFQAHHLRRLHTETEVPPAVDQFECHPYLTQDDLRAFCGNTRSRSRAGRRSPGAARCWPTRRSSPSPSGPARPRPRWCCAGTSSAATSSSPSRSPRPGSGRTSTSSTSSCPARTSATISALNRNERTGPDPDTFDMV